MNEANPETHVKIAFEYQTDDGWEVETMSAVPVDVGYRVDNIPFFMRGIAWGDVVRAVPDAEGFLIYEALVTPSGHSTLRLWITNAADVQAVRDALQILGCGSELGFKRLLAVDVPPEVRYSEIIAFVAEKEKLGALDYEEGCIGHDT